MIYIHRRVPILSLFLIALVPFAFSTCDDDPSSPDSEPLSDEALFSMATADSNWTWFLRSADTLETASTLSGHNEPLVRTRYNETAENHLDSEGKVKNGTTFNEESMIVKELYLSDGTLNSVAVMLKRSTSDFADEADWVWGYYQANGTVRKSIEDLGSGCRGCHQPGIDYTMMNAGHTN